MRRINYIAETFHTFYQFFIILDSRFLKELSVTYKTDRFNQVLIKYKIITFKISLVLAKIKNILNNKKPDNKDAIHCTLYHSINYCSDSSFLLLTNGIIF